MPWYLFSTPKELDSNATSALFTAVAGVVSAVALGFLVYDKLVGRFKTHVTVKRSKEIGQSTAVYVTNGGREPFTVLSVQAEDSEGNVIHTIYELGPNDDEAPFLVPHATKVYPWNSLSMDFARAIVVKTSLGDDARKVVNEGAQFNARWGRLMQVIASTTHGYTDQQKPTHQEVTAKYSDVGNQSEISFSTPPKASTRQVARIYPSPGHKAAEDVAHLASTFSCLFSLEITDGLPSQSVLNWTDNGIRLYAEKKMSDVNTLIKRAEKVVLEVQAVRESERLAILADRNKRETNGTEG